MEDGAGELFALNRGPPVLSARTHACAGCGECNPRADPLCADIELTRQLCRHAISHRQPDDMLLECRRVRRLCLGQLGPFLIN
jgi:hypothetical protein